MTNDYRLDLTLPSIHRKIDARNIGALVGSKERGGGSNLFRLSDSPQRDRRNDRVRKFRGLLFGQAHFTEDRRLNRAGTDRVHPDLSVLEIGRPRPGEGTHGRLGRAIYAESPDAFVAGDRGVQDDRTTILK